MNFRSIRYLLFLAVSCLALTVAADDSDIGVEISLDRDSIGLDEHAIMKVVISGPSQNLPSPQLTTMPTFEIYSQGRSTNISVQNGRVSASNTYRYMLLPKRAGTFPIDQISIVYNNRRYKGNAVELVVLNQGSSTPPELEEEAVDPRGKSKDYFLEAVVDKKRPFVGEQVTLTLKFYIAVQYYGSPELVEPTTTGFWNEVLGNKAPYRQRINGVQYKVIERKYALFPSQTGDLTIGSATIKATVADRKKRYRDPFDVLGDMFGRGVEVSTRSKALRVNVRPLPTEGKPEEFSGTVGQFKLETFADKRRVELNQPVTLKVQISGSGNVKSIAEPTIPSLDDFRVYRASSNENLTKADDKIGGSKIFEEVFIPRRPGELEIPALAFNYFDTRTKKYRTLTSKPIKINVTKPEGYVDNPDIPYGSPGLTISSQANEIRYIKSDIGDVHPPGEVLLTTPLYLIVNSVPVLILAGLVLVRRRRERLDGNIGLARSRSASSKARKQLTRARSLANEADAEQFFAEISSALTSYIANKLNISPHGLTMDGLEQILRERSAEESLISEMQSVLTKCDFARFASSSIRKEEIDQTLSLAEQLIIRLEGVNLA
ncbi:MAG: BatD family protein [bacterium]|nr:BatD family protein [bacterium]